MRVRLGQRSRKPLSLAIVLACVLAGGSGPLVAQQPQGATPQREHVVRRGDTLWDIARAYLSNPFLWPLIFEANRQVVEDPHWIYPAERLMIPSLTPTAPIPTPDAAAAAEAPQTWGAVDRSRTSFYKPPAQEPPSRQEPGPTVLQTVEPERFIVPPAEFRSTPFLADSAELGVVGRLIRLADPALETERLPPAVRPFDRVYVGRLQGSLPAAGDTVVVVHLGRSVGAAGRVIEPTALLRIDSVGGTVMSAQVVRQFAPTRLGDVVMRLEAAPSSVIEAPRDVAGGPEGTILAFAEPQPLYSTLDRGFVSLGASHGLAVGDELLAYLPERSARTDHGERLPPTPVATLRVVRVRQNTATVRVVAMENTVLKEGLPVRVVRKVP